jgi:hypothetical protein
MPKPEDYKHIRAWGRMMLSYEYYIVQEQEQAAKDNAPIDAIYKRDTWRRFADVENPDSRMRVEQELARMETAKPKSGRKR